MKFIHCSDIHLGRRPVGGKGEYSDKRFEDYFNVFENMVDFAVKKQIELLLIAGDLFDRKELNPEVLEKTEKILIKLKDNNITVLLIEGNHDNIIIGSESDSWLIYLENKNFLKRLTYAHDENGYNFTPYIYKTHVIYGLGYPGVFADEVLGELSSKIDNKYFNIIIIHTSISSNNYVPGCIKKETLDLFKNKNAYIAGGHTHSFFIYPEKNPFFFIPGSLEYWDLGENNENKGFIIYDTENKIHQFINSNPRIKSEYFFEIKSSDFENFKNEFLELIKNIEIKKDEIILINLNLQNSFLLDISWCENQINEKGALKSVIKTKYLDLNNQDYDKSVMTQEQIEKELINQWEFLGDKTEDAYKIFQKLKNFQIENNKDLFMENFDKLLETIING